MRPTVPASGVSEAVAGMLQRSWDSLPDRRPSFVEIVRVLCAELGLPDDEMERCVHKYTHAHALMQ